MKRRLGRLHSQSGSFREKINILSLSGFEYLIFQLVAYSLY
jgi:hypothetical protein